MKLLAAALLLSGSVAAQYRINGTVVDRASNNPLSAVLVRLSPAEKPGATVTSLTGGDGRFAFSQVAAGKYLLTAQRPNERPQAFHADGQYSTAIVVGPGLTGEGLIFPLRAAASISGSVTDEDGDPVVNGDVLLFYESASEGEPRIVQNGVWRIDAAGHFHIGGLQPGTYLVGVKAIPWFAATAPRSQGFSIPGTRSAEMDVAYPLTYYNGTTDPDAAAPITVAEGATVQVQVNLRAVPAIHVPLQGAEPERNWGLSCNLFVVGPGNSRIAANTAMQIGGPNGTELMGIPAGHYIVQVQRNSEGKPGPLLTGEAELADGVPVAVSSSPVTVSGHISFSGAQVGPDTAVDLTMLSRQFGAVAKVRPDGSFDFSGQPLLPGEYEVGLESADFYVGSMEVKGAGRSGSRLELSANSAAELSLVGVPVASLSKLEGFVLQDDKPLAGAMVLLVPEDLSNTNAFRRDQSDSDGSFSLLRVRPGKYTLLAIDDGFNLAYKDAAAIKPYLAQGVVVSVPVATPVKITVQRRRPV